MMLVLKIWVVCGERLHYWAYLSHLFTRFSVASRFDSWRRPAISTRPESHRPWLLGIKPHIEIDFTLVDEPLPSEVDLRIVASAGITRAGQRRLPAWSSGARSLGG